MTSRTKNEKHRKFPINCAFGEKCARRNCSFIHPDGRNLVENQRKLEQERQKNLTDLQLQQRVNIMAQCRHGDICHRVDCPFQHSPNWDPQKNQQLAEVKRQRDEQRREEQRKHAFDVSMKETIPKKNELDTFCPQNKPLQNDQIGEEYEYDDAYFDIHEKIWEKQLVRHCY